MLNSELFHKLIKDNNGFEVTLGFRNNADHFIGGKGNKYWYFIKNGSEEDYYICTEAGEDLTDIHYKRKRKVLTSEPAVSGETIRLILNELSVGQKEIEESGHKPVKIELYGHSFSHYSFAFGERAYRISDEYGITAEYSNIKDENGGFRLRNIETGKKVKAPSEN